MASLNLVVGTDIRAQLELCMLLFPIALAMRIANATWSTLHFLLGKCPVEKRSEEIEFDDNPVAQHVASKLAESKELHDTRGKMTGEHQAVCHDTRGASMAMLEGSDEEHHAVFESES